MSKTKSSSCPYIADGIQETYAAYGELSDIWLEALSELYTNIQGLVDFGCKILKIYCY